MTIGHRRRVSHDAAWYYNSSLQQSPCNSPVIPIRHDTGATHSLTRRILEHGNLYEPRFCEGRRYGPEQSGLDRTAGLQLGHVSPDQKCGRRRQAPYVGEISVTKYIDSASSTIQQYAFKAIVNACTIQYVHTDIGGGKVFRSLQLANCIISSVNSDGGTHERPKEYLTLNFTEITVSDTVYTDQDSEGTQSNVVYSLEQSTTL